MVSTLVLCCVVLCFILLQEMLFLSILNFRLQFHLASKFLKTVWCFVNRISGMWRENSVMGML